MQKILGNLLLLKTPNLKNRNSLQKLVTRESPSIYRTHFEKQSHINEQNELVSMVKHKLQIHPSPPKYTENKCTHNIQEWLTKI